MEHQIPVTKFLQFYAKYILHTSKTVFQISVDKYLIFSIELINLYFYSLLNGKWCKPTVENEW